MKMKKAWALAAALGATLIASPLIGQASTPAEDLQEFRDYFMKRFPNVAFADYKDGAYALDAAAREQWEAIEEFPPYELSIDRGEELFNTPFANGQTYASCFKNGGIGIRQLYPYFDAEAGKVKTLEGEINECRVKNGEKPLRTKKGDIADISAYMAYTSRGEIIDVRIPDDPRALAIYNRGKTHFYQKRGQLNMSCADCHQYYSGRQVRVETLSPALGQPTGFPVYRSKWNELGTLHRRYAGCNDQVRAADFPAQGDEYTALEYFHTYMSNGLEVNGPSARK
jgi:sulfur-oxidizing protein SoxA